MKKLPIYITAFIVLATFVACGPQNQIPPLPVIESAYYLIGEVIESWEEEDVLKFNHSGKDVYEDAIFTLILNNPIDKANFKIIPQSGVDGSADFWESALGTAVDGDDSPEGTLLTGNPGAIQIANAGWTRITLDMMAYTYKIEPYDASPYLWVPGNYQGWEPADAPQLYSTAMDLIYTGHMYLDGGFKLTGQADWVPTEYGYSYFSALSNNITDGGGGIMNVDPGYYFIRVNLNTNAIEAIPTQWGIIGNATPGGWDTDTAMTYNKTLDTWNVTVDLVPGELKFRANNDWDINMGGSLDKLLFNGDNISVADDGTYTFTLHLGNDSNSYCIVEKN